MIENENDVSWKDLDARLYSELKDGERKQLLAIRNEQALTARLNVLRNQRQTLKREGTWGRVHKVADLLKPVAQAADILAQGVCLPSQTLWGAFGLIVDVSPTAKSPAFPSPPPYTRPPAYLTYFHIAHQFSGRSLRQRALRV